MMQEPIITNLDNDVKIYTKPRENLKIYNFGKEDIHKQLENIKPLLMAYLNSYPFSAIADEFDTDAIIIGLRFGFAGNKELSSEEIASILGMKEEKVSNVVNSYLLYMKEKLLNEFSKLENPKSLKKQTK